MCFILNDMCSYASHVHTLVYVVYAHMATCDRACAKSLAHINHTYNKRHMCTNKYRNVWTHVQHGCAFDAHIVQMSELCIHMSPPGKLGISYVACHVQLRLTCANSCLSRACTYGHMWPDVCKMIITRKSHVQQVPHVHNIYRIECTHVQHGCAREAYIVHMWKLCIYIHTPELNLAFHMCYMSRDMWDYALYVHTLVWFLCALVVT